MKNKLFKIFDYYQDSNSFIIVYLLILSLFPLLILRLDSNNIYEEGLVYIKIMIVILNVYYFIYLINIKFYDFTIFFSYQRLKISLYYLYRYLKYAVTSGLFIYLIFTIMCYLKVKYYKLDVNLLAMIIYYFIIVILFNSIVTILVENKIGIIFLFIINLVILFLSLIITNNDYFPNILYNSDYYLQISSLNIYLYLLVLLFFYFFLFNIKERRWRF